jgi:hypothetical protein
MRLITTSIPLVVYIVTFGLSKLVCYFAKLKKNLVLIYGLLFALITMLILSVVAILEYTSPSKESVSGFMIISGFMTLPWSLIPGFFTLFGSIGSIFNELNERYGSWVSYSEGVLMVTCIWFLNGSLTGLFLTIFKARKEDAKDNRSKPNHLP